LTNTGELAVFLVDDDTAVRQLAASIARSLKRPFEAFDSVEKFLEAFDPSRPGCLITEVRLPGMSGLELLEKLHSGENIFTAVVLSADAEPSTIVRAMKAGAFDFLKKPCGEQQLLESLHKALEHDAAVRRRHAQVARICARKKKLTDGENEVLALLLAGRMNREIADALKVSVRTVEVRRSKLMDKMKASSLAELIRAAVLAEIHAAKEG
jgi:two-component system, LuxR family, response regulator FixJ